MTPPSSTDCNTTPATTTFRFKKLGLINQAPTKNGGFLPLFNI